VGGWRVVTGLWVGMLPPAAGCLLPNTLAMHHAVRVAARRLAVGHCMGVCGGKGVRCPILGSQHPGCQLGQNLLLATPQPLAAAGRSSSTRVLLRAIMCDTGCPVAELLPDLLACGVSNEQQFHVHCGLCLMMDGNMHLDRCTSPTPSSRVNMQPDANAP
jgi:hypothetical protein